MTDSTLRGPLGRSSFLKIVLLWGCWLAVVLCFQGLASARLQPQPPDRAQQWTADETMPGSQDGKIYLNEAFLNNQVAWDSEFYLSIATRGYDDSAVGAARTPIGTLPLNYAFFPFYPAVMRVAAAPMQWFGMPPIAAASLAGVIVSALGTLAACFALCSLSRTRTTGGTGQPTGVPAESPLPASPALADPDLRAVFYFLIFPTGFFLAQVYSEGLFCGLAFGAMALAQRRKFVWAAVLAACAVWTRAVGIALLIPLAMAWWQSIDRKNFALSRVWKEWRGLLLLVPVGALLLWRVLLGERFSMIEENFFGRGFLSIGASLFGYGGWGEVFGSLGGDNPHMAAHNIVMLICSAAALVCAVAALKTHRGPALFAIAAFAIAALSGSAQSMARYVLVLPTTYLVLAEWAKNQVFDRIWTFVSVLLFAILTLLYTANFWVA